jgi:exodeoxyribonuclease V alpha subunit
MSDPNAIANEVLNLITERLPAKYGITPADVMVLTALREKGELSAVGLNVRLRAKLNPGSVGRWGVGKWAVGDRVIQTSNNYELDVMNGDIGTIVGVDGPNLRIVFDTPTRELRGTAGIDGDFDLMYAWALTIHRAQGSEWPWVIIPIHEQQGQMVVNANSLYTAISRARNGCVVVGSRAALEGAAARHREVRRWTRLASLLS